MKGKLLSVALLLLSIVVLGGTAQAAGPHDANCVSCHNVHYAKGNFIIGPQPNTSMDNPATNAKTGGADALCLGCHNDAEGIMPIHLGTTHPTGVAPIYVKVPAKLLRDGKMSCVSCHNPHPSNTNYKYLVADTKKGTGMGVFCAVCHSEQAVNAERTSAGSVSLNFGPRAEARVAVSGSTKQVAVAKPAAVGKSAVAVKY